MQAVFVNCPNGGDYLPLLRSLLFTVYKCGYEPRLASEVLENQAKVLDKVFTLVHSTSVSIHDLSLCQCQTNSTAPEYYRMNMPFELGFDMAHSLGLKQQGIAEKKILVLEGTRHSLSKAMSDFSNNAPQAHESKQIELIRIVYHFFVVELRIEDHYSPLSVMEEFRDFERDIRDEIKDKLPESYRSGSSADLIQIINKELDDLPVRILKDKIRKFLSEE